MFSWVVKVVPPPPEPPGKLGDEEKTNAPPAPVKQVTFKEEKKQEALKPAKAKEEEVAEENGKMLTKDKEPEEKGEAKETSEVIPDRPETPKLFKAALVVTEQAGIKGTFAKLKEGFKPTETESSGLPIPPPSPMVHLRSPIPPTHPRVENDEDAVPEATDSMMLIRMTRRHKSEELLSVEQKPGDEEEEKE